MFATLAAEYDHQTATVPGFTDQNTLDLAAATGSTTAEVHGVLHIFFANAGRLECQRLSNLTGIAPAKVRAIILASRAADRTRSNA